MSKENLLTKIKNKIKKDMENDKIYEFLSREFNWGWFKFLKCIFGVFIFSLAINLFIVPNNLYTGGTLGLSQLIRSALVSIFNIHPKIDISSIIYYLINVPLLLLAYKKISKKFFIRTIFTLTLNSLFLIIIPIPETPIINDLLANVLIGGIICGIGVGMTLSTGSSTGGTDILGILITQKTNAVTVGNISIIFNTLVYSICGLKYGLSIMVYSIIYAVFENILLDKNYLLSIKSEAIIFTKHNPEKIIHYINFELNRGATYWEAIGGFTNTKTYIVYAVLSKYEKMRLERHMHEFDKEAFVVGHDGIDTKGDFPKYMI